MKVTHSIRSSFGAATASEDQTRLAIHHYTVVVSQTDAPALEQNEIRTALIGLIAQLRGRQLDKMLGMAATPSSIAHWMIESLALRFPRISSVSITEDDDVTVTVTREEQRL